MSPLSTVAITTARTTEQTTFKVWFDVWRSACLRQKYKGNTFPSAIHGEFLSLLGQARTITLDPAIVVLKENLFVQYHLMFQMECLAAGTALPHCILFVDRTTTERLWLKTRAGAELRREPPKRAQDELHGDGPRDAKTSRGCNDKNTAILQCPRGTDVLILLDDCCLPSYGLVETVEEYFEDPTHANDVFLIGHRKYYLPVENRGFGWGEANWVEKRTTWTVEEARKTRRVLGILAARLDTFLAVNGFNEDLDGSRNGLDEELLVRMDRYLLEVGGKYVADPNVRCYEIEHDLPWSTPTADARTWLDKLPEGYRAPGPDLRELRK